jgi:hypothetical protein
MSDEPKKRSRAWIVWPALLKRQTSIRIAVRNLGTRASILYLEPWGEEFQMPPQTEFIFIGHGPRYGSGFSVDYLDDSVVVAAWNGSTVQVFSDDQELGSMNLRPRVPDFD